MGWRTASVLKTPYRMSLPEDASVNDPNGFGRTIPLQLPALDNNVVLDVANGSKDNQANVQIYQSNMSDAQKWEVKWFEYDADEDNKQGDGYYAIFRKGSTRF